MNKQHNSIEKNQLLRFSNLMANIKRRTVEPGSEPFLFSESEFAKLCEIFTVISKRVPANLGFYLEFHLAEAKRLKKQINTNQLTGTDHSGEAIFRFNIISLFLIKLLTTLLHEHSPPKKQTAKSAYTDSPNY